MALKNQEQIAQSGNANKVIAGDDKSSNVTYVTTRNGKLSTLFEKLKAKFENNDTISQISDELKKYIDRRDTLGLEEKLSNANMNQYYEDFAWCKQEFYKKLVRYQNYEPAQEIFAFILAIVLERYRNLIKPLIRAGSSESIILEKISKEIINPILTLIEEEGCNDIMAINSTDIEGMYHYLTGNCHINWSA